MTVNNTNVNNFAYLRGENIKKPCSVGFLGSDNTKTPSVPKVLESSIPDNFEYRANPSAELSLISAEFDEIKSKNGPVGILWDGIKNLFSLKNGSKNVKNLIESAKSGKISAKTAKERLDAYKEGQKMCVDVFGDILSGILAVGACALSPFSGGLSFLVAAGTGAVFKVGIKAADSAVAGKKYQTSDFGYDIITGSMNGFMAPFSNAVGGAVGTGVAKALGIKSVETSVKSGVKSGAKTLLLKALAYGADVSVDGALSGATDAFSRAVAGKNFDDAPENILKGAIGGAIGGVLIGGLSKLVFKGASKLKSVTGDKKPTVLAPAADTKNLVRDVASPKDGTFVGFRIELTDVDFSTPIKADSEELMEIARVISSQNEALKDSAVLEFTNAAKCPGIKYSSRAKGVESTFNKLNSKVKAGAKITSMDDAYKLIADGVGTRAIFESLSAERAVSALKKAGITDSEIDILKSAWLKNTTDGLDESQKALLSKANRILSEAQTNEFVSKLARAIENNEISITEINNYAGENGIAYFSDEQILKIYKAWEKSASTGDFSIVTGVDKDSKLAMELGFDSEYLSKISNKSKKPSGYTACQSNFKYSNGALGEGQFRGSEIDIFAEYEHFPYDIKKKKTTVQKKIEELIRMGKKDVAKELSEYQDLVRVLARDKALYAQYNAYLSDVYNYLRKKELGIVDIVGEMSLPRLQIEGLSPHELELLSKECLESLSKKEFYTFKNP